MFKALRELVGSVSTTSDAPQVEPVAAISEHELYAVALMLEIASADHQLDESEQEQIRLYIEVELQLSSADADAIFEQAQGLAKDATSLHQFTQHLKNLDYDERLSIFKALWETAYADGELDPHEEAMLRKIADLLYISHSDYIQLKLAVLETTDKGDESKAT